MKHSLFEVSITREVEAVDAATALELAKEGHGRLYGSEVVLVPICPQCGAHWQAEVIVEAVDENGQPHSETCCTACAKFRT